MSSFLKDAFTVGAGGKNVELTRVWYGPIPFLSPTKNIQTYGNMITKDKSSSTRSIIGVSEGETVVTFMGYLIGPTKGIFKRMLSTLRSVQLRVSEMMSGGGLSNFLAGGVFGSIAGLVLKGIATALMAVVNFPVISELAVESFMMIKSMVYTHASEQKDAFTYIVNLEKTKPSFGGIAGKIVAGATILANIGMILRDLYQFYNYRRRMPYINTDTVTADATPRLLTQTVSVSELENNDYDASVPLGPSGVGFNPNKTWRKLPLQQTIGTQSILFTIDSSSYKIVLQVYSRTVTDPENGNTKKDWVLKVDVTDQSDSVRLLSQIVNEGRYYKLKEDLTLGIDTLQLEYNNTNLTKFAVSGMVTSD